ncbi:MAG TPA: STAS domain-containing protein [Anaeromyxobacteraceae bacterium]|nr:STAS domain-containing protein [Anaeromyxobacteraceae bacterium]
MLACTIERTDEGSRAIYLLAGGFDRASAWALRERVERESAAEEVLLDFTRVREFSDLGVAVLAHGLTGASRRVVFRGLRQHELRIFRYCGVAVEELVAEPPARAGAAEMTA